MFSSILMNSASETSHESSKYLAVSRCQWNYETSIVMSLSPDGDLITVCASFCIFYTDSDEELSYLLLLACNRDRKHFQRKIGIYFGGGYTWKNNSYILKYRVLWFYVLLYNLWVSQLFLFCCHHFLRKFENVLVSLISLI